MGVMVDKNLSKDIEEVEDVKILRRMANKDRTLQRRQARQMKKFMRTNG